MNGIDGDIVVIDGEPHRLRKYLIDDGRDTWYEYRWEPLERPAPWWLRFLGWIKAKLPSPEQHRKESDR